MTDLRRFGSTLLRILRALNCHVLRNGRMRRSIEELERLEHASGITPSPRKIANRRILAWYVDQVRSIVLMLTLLFLGYWASISWFFHNYMTGDDVLHILMDAAFLTTALYFAGTGWFRAQWRYRWYPAVAMGVLATYVGVTYVIQLAAGVGAGS